MAFKKTCIGCGTDFETGDIRKQRCRPNCSRDESARNRASEARETARAAHYVEFIGVDGEGVTRYVWDTEYDDDGEEITVRHEIHDYVLLSAGSESLHKNGAALTHKDVFRFLWDQFLEHPNAAFVGFFLGYDFTMWLKSLSEHSAWELLHKDGIAYRQPMPDSDRRFPFPVRDGFWGYQFGMRGIIGRQWEFDILGTKRFKLRPYIHPSEVPTRIVNHRDGTQSEQKISRPWMYICDAGSFFQTSFLKAINPKDWTEPVCTPAEFAVIEEGKQRRDVAVFDDDMIRYNVLENEILARVMTRMNEGYVEDGIRLTKQQWMGPGQAAQAWMKVVGVPTGEMIREIVPQYARDAARMSYYGGWFEIFNHGPVPGTSYAYDINSAYPAIIAKLPCLLHGTWKTGTGALPRLTPTTLRLVYATVRGNDKWVGAMMHRQPDGRILRPQQTKGWYWWHEVQASKRAGCIRTVEVHEWIDYKPCACPPPMADIVELYEGRLRVGKNSPAGKAKKTTYNSAYGKLAQSIGMPRFANPVYASLITAGCRTMILDAIATHPTKTASLLMIATDGIVFKEPHPGLDIDKTRLGAWDDEEYQNLSLFMPGLYWDDNARADIEAGNDPKLKSRGVSSRDIAKVIRKVDTLWHEYGPDLKFPEVRMPIEWGMISGKLAISRNAWETCGKIERGEVRVLSGNPEAKRDVHLVREWGGLRSYPYPYSEEFETTYYERGFGEVPIDDDIAEHLVTPDAPSVAAAMSWAISTR